jgi:hypothetical protein
MAAGRPDRKRQRADSGLPKPSKRDGRGKKMATAAAERMRIARARRKKGYRCIVVEIHDGEIDALVRRGLLERADAEDPGSIQAALYRLFERHLNE